VHLIPNGVDTLRFAPPATPRRRGRPACILYVGRFSPEKNLETVVTAAAALGRWLPARLILVGAGPLQARLRERARVTGVEVEFPGVVPQERLPPYYAAADAFVLASFTEGHPKALLEAMAAGVPCVVSDCEGNRSLVADGKTGLLFDPHQPDQLADRLARVLTDTPLAEALGGAARALVVDRYDLGTLVGVEIALLRHAAAMYNRASLQ
jgi:glycosyltransferase involved in cell wall biosynthesis